MNDAAIRELRDEFQAKITSMHQHFDSTIATVQSRVDEAKTLASDAATSAQLEFQRISERQEVIESKVEHVASSLCTKQDFSALLQEAMRQQASEFRQMISKRTPDQSPMHGEGDSKAAKYH